MVVLVGLWGLASACGDSSVSGASGSGGGAGGAGKNGNSSHGTPQEAPASTAAYACPTLKEVRAKVDPSLVIGETGSLCSYVPLPDGVTYEEAEPGQFPYVLSLAHPPLGYTGDPDEFLEHELSETKKVMPETLRGEGDFGPESFMIDTDGMCAVDAYAVDGVPVVIGALGTAGPDVDLCEPVTKMAHLVTDY